MYEALTEEEMDKEMIYAEQKGCYFVFCLSIPVLIRIQSYPT